MKQPILVAGGAGLLGFHLCEKLLGNGHDVICVDNLFTGSKDNILHFKDNPYFSKIIFSSILDEKLERTKKYLKKSVLESI